MLRSTIHIDLLLLPLKLQNYKKTSSFLLLFQPFGVGEEELPNIEPHL